MTNIITLRDAKSAIEVISARNKDYAADINTLSVEENGRLTFKGRERYADGSLSDMIHPVETLLTQQALSQYYSMLEIPTGYAQRVPFELMRPHIKYAMQKFEGFEKDLLIRTTRQYDDSTVSHTRALLTTRYGLIDNGSILDALIQVMDDQVEVKEFAIDNFGDMMNLRLIDKGFSYIGTSPEGKSNPYYAGTHVTNGETGKYSISLNAIVFEQWCTNGAVRERFGEALLRMKHLGTADKLTQEFRSASNALPLIHEQSMNSFRQSQTIQVIDPQLMLYNLLRRHSSVFDKTLTKHVVKSYDKRDEPTRYGIASAITEAAQKVDFERRLRAEKLAGDILFFDYPLDAHGDRQKALAALDEIRYGE